MQCCKINDRKNQKVNRFHLFVSYSAAAELLKNDVTFSLSVICCHLQFDNYYSALPNVKKQPDCWSCYVYVYVRLSNFELIVRLCINNINNCDICCCCPGKHSGRRSFRANTPLKTVKRKKFFYNYYEVGELRHIGYTIITNVCEYN